MRISNTNTLKIGAFIVAGLLLFVLGIYFLGKHQDMFRSTVTVMTEFSNIKGLKVGNNIRFLGINAGAISNISISNDTIVLVEMQIDKKISLYIREDSKVGIENDGIMGTKIITIQTGTSSAGPIKEQTILPSVTTMTIEEVFGGLEETVKYSTEAAKNLMMMSEKIKSGEGDLGSFINDSTLKITFDELSKNLMFITDDAKEIVNKANNGDNDFARLLNENTITSQLNKILTDADTIAINLKTSSKEIKQTTQEINHGNGVMNKVLFDSAFAEDIDTTVINIKNGIDDVNEISAVIADSWILQLFKRNKKRIKKDERNNSNRN